MTGAVAPYAGAIGAVAAAALSAVAAWWAARRKGKSDDQAAQAAMIKAATEAATAVTSMLQTQVDRMDRELKSLRRDLAAEKLARTEERHALARRAAVAEAALHEAQKNARNERQHLQQIIDSLIRRLQEAGLPIPDPGVRDTQPILLGAPSP